MVKKGFPSFGITQSGAFVAALKNYNLPDFILALVAKDSNSDLLKRGRIDDRLSSMNDTALELLHRVFVDCEEDKEGKYAQYRFFAYVSSMYHKCEVLMYIAIGFNKPTGHAVSKKDIQKFHEIANDIKNGEHGTQLVDAIFASSAGFKGEAIVELEKLSKADVSDPEYKLNFKTANFENRIYSITKC